MPIRSVRKRPHGNLFVREIRRHTARHVGTARARRAPAGEQTTARNPCVSREAWCGATPWAAASAGQRGCDVGVMPGCRRWLAGNGTSAGMGAVITATVASIKNPQVGLATSAQVACDDGSVSRGGPLVSKVARTRQRWTAAVGTAPRAGRAAALSVEAHPSRTLANGTAHSSAQILSLFMTRDDGRREAGPGDDICAAPGGCQRRFAPMVGLFGGAARAGRSDTDYNVSRRFLLPCEPVLVSVRGMDTDVTGCRRGAGRAHARRRSRPPRRAVHARREEGCTRVLPKMERCNARTMEIYRRMGLARKIRAAGLIAACPWTSTSRSR